MEPIPSHAPVDGFPMRKYNRQHIPKNKTKTRYQKKNYGGKNTVFLVRLFATHLGCQIRASIFFLHDVLRKNSGLARKGGFVSLYQKRKFLWCSPFGYLLFGGVLAINNRLQQGVHYINFSLEGGGVPPTWAERKKLGLKYNTFYKLSITQHESQSASVVICASFCILSWYFDEVVVDA